jgi:uncharacterized membrane protein
MIPGLLALAAALGFGLWALPSLPDQVASHWGLSGEPDGWSSKGTLVYLLPLFGVGIALLLGVVPRIDPRKASFELHGSTYWTLANASIVVLAGVHVELIAYNLGWPVRINQIVGIAVGGLSNLEASQRRPTVRHHRHFRLRDVARTRRRAVAAFRRELGHAPGTRAF